MILKLRNLGEAEVFCEWEIHEVTLHLDGNVEVTDRSALVQLCHDLFVDILRAFLVELEETWMLLLYIEEVRWAGFVFDDTMAFEITG